MPSKPAIAILAAALLAFATPAAAQRASLSERVTRLEQQTAAGQGNLALLNQITQLRNELKTLRAQIEELRQAQELAAERARSQYLDLDSRLIRLEGGTPALPPVALPDASAADVVGSADAGAGDAAVLEAPSDSIGRAASVPPETVLPPPPGNEQDDYLAAFAVLKSGDYAGSARAFQDFLQRYPGGSYAPNALYWLGESYYVTQNYALAQQQFQTLLDRYPTDAKAPAALLKVGLSQYGQDQLEAARATLDAVVQRYPGSNEAEIASDRLRAMQLAGMR